MLNTLRVGFARRSALCGIMFVLSSLAASAAQEAAPVPGSETTVDSRSIESRSQAADAAEPRTLFGEALKGHWNLTAEATVGQQYDDNVFPSTALRLSDNVSDFSFRISAGIHKKRLVFQAHYLPEYMLHAKYSGIN